MSDNRYRAEDGSPPRSSAVTVVDENRRRMVRAGLAASRPTLAERDDVDALANLLRRPIQIEVDDRPFLVSTRPVLEIVPTSRPVAGPSSFYRRDDIIDVEHETIEDTPEPVGSPAPSPVPPQAPEPEAEVETLQGEIDPSDLEIVAVDEATGQQMTINWKALSRAMHPGIHTAAADPSSVSASAESIEAALEVSERRARRMMADLVAQASSKPVMDDLPFVDRLLVDATMIEAAHPETAERLRVASKEIETLSREKAEREDSITLLLGRVEELEAVKVVARPTEEDRIGAEHVPAPQSGGSIMDAVRRKLGLGQ